MTLTYDPPLHSARTSHSSSSNTSSRRTSMLSARSSLASESDNSYYPSRSRYNTRSQSKPKSVFPSSTTIPSKRQQHFSDYEDNNNDDNDEDGDASDTATNRTNDEYVSLINNHSPFSSSDISDVDRRQSARLSDLHNQLQKVMDIKVFDSHGRPVTSDTVLYSPNDAAGPTHSSAGGEDAKPSRFKLEHHDHMDEEFIPFNPLPAHHKEAPIYHDDYDDHDDVDDVAIKVEERAPTTRDARGGFISLFRGVYYVLASPFHLLLWLEQSIVRLAIHIIDYPVSSLIVLPITFPFFIISQSIRLVDNTIVAAISYIISTILFGIQQTLKLIFCIVITIFTTSLKSPYYLFQLVLGLHEAFFEGLVLFIQTLYRVSFSLITTFLELSIDIPVAIFKTELSLLFFVYYTIRTIERGIVNTMASLTRATYSTSRLLLSALIFAISIPFSFASVVVNIVCFPFRIATFIFSAIQTLLLFSIISAVLVAYFASDGFRDAGKLASSVSGLKDVAAGGKVLLGAVPEGMRSVEEAVRWIRFHIGAMHIPTPSQMSETIVEAGTSASGKWTRPGVVV